MYKQLFERSRISAVEFPSEALGAGDTARLSGPHRTQYRLVALGILRC